MCDTSGSVIGTARTSAPSAMLSGSVAGTIEQTAPLATCASSATIEFDSKAVSSAVAIVTTGVPAWIAGLTAKAAAVACSSVSATTTATVWPW